MVVTKATVYFRTNKKWVMSLKIKLICEMKSKIKLRVLFFDSTMQIRIADLSFKVKEFNFRKFLTILFAFFSPVLGLEITLPIQKELPF